MDDSGSHLFLSQSKGLNWVRLHKSGVKIYLYCCWKILSFYKIYFTIPKTTFILLDGIYNSLHISDTTMLIDRILLVCGDQSQGIFLCHQYVISFKIKKLKYIVKYNKN